MYTTNTMDKVRQNCQIKKDNKVQCISACGDHVWVASRDGTTGQGAIDIFDTSNGKLVHTVCLKRNCVSCMAYSDRAQYCGTLEGYCFSFSRDIEMVRSKCKAPLRVRVPRCTGWHCCDCRWPVGISHLLHFLLASGHPCL